jgi:hypothetical protein
MNRRTPQRSVAEPCNPVVSSLLALLRVSLELPLCFRPIETPTSALRDATDHALLVGGFFARALVSCKQPSMFTHRSRSS